MPFVRCGDRCIMPTLKKQVNRLAGNRIQPQRRVNTTSLMLPLAGVKTPGNRRMRTRSGVGGSDPASCQACWRGIRFLRE